jgi:hypothetical protein
MLLINRVKLYSLHNKKEPTTADNISTQEGELETMGNKNSTICCFISCSSSLSMSKDYKILAKVFEKLMMKIENIFVVNVNSKKSTSFIHFIHEYQFAKIILFGEHAKLDNIPIQLINNQPATYELLKILLTENLIDLTESKDLALKQACWSAIQSFYKS